MTTGTAAWIFSLSIGIATGCVLALIDSVVRPGSGLGLARLFGRVVGSGGMRAMLAAKLPKGLKGFLPAKSRFDQAGEGDLEIAFLALAAELEAGASVPGALARVESESPQALAVELRALREGMVRGEGLAAVRAWAEQRSDPSLEDLAAALEIQGGLGGSLGPTLRKLAEMHRHRRILALQMRTKSAEARFSAQILAAAPLALGAYFVVFHPSMLAPLWTDPLGRWSLAYGVVSWWLGLYGIRRLLKIPNAGGQP